MSCLADVKKAIFDDIKDKFITGRPSFKWTGEGFEITQQMKNKSKNNATEQAKQIMISTIKRINSEYNGHVRGTITEPISIYDGALKANLEINPAYIDKVYNSQVSDKTNTDEDNKILFSMSPIANYDEEQNWINGNVGANHGDEASSEPEFANPRVGNYLTYIDHLEAELKRYEQRLAIIDNKRNSPLTSAAEQAKLVKEGRNIRNEIKGNRDAGIKGIEQDIYELKKRANEVAVGYYVEKDLARLKKLSESDNINELEEAKKIIDFYELAGNFIYNKEEKSSKSNNKWTNPFFLETDVYFFEDGENTGEFRLTDKDREIYANWGNRASNYRITIDKKLKEVANGIIRDSASMNKTFTDPTHHTHTIDELADGKDLKDTHWFDMWTMDITKNLARRDSLLPQLIASELEDAIFKRQGESMEFAHRADEQRDKVLKRLKDIGQTLKSKGIGGIDQGVYGIFLERNSIGQLTGGYSHKFTQEYTNETARINAEFQEKLSEGFAESNQTERKRLLAKAFKDKRDWDRKNNIIMEFHKLPEIQDDAEFAEYENFYDRAGAEAYKKYILSVIGQKEYNNQVAQQKYELRRYVADKQSHIDTILESGGITETTDMNEAQKKELRDWIVQNSPFYGINNYFQTTFNNGNYAGNYQKYNIMLPRRNDVTITLNNDTDMYAFTDKVVSHPKQYYNKEFEDNIENDEVLHDFHILVKDAMEYVKKLAPPDLAKRMAVNYLSSMDKTSAEIITNNYDSTSKLGRVIPAFNTMWQNIRLGFGANKQSDQSPATTDHITGKPNHTVNDSFLRTNKNAIDEKITIEKAKFLRAFNTNNNNKIGGLRTFTKLNLSRFNKESLILLSDYLNIDISIDDINNGRIDAIRARTGDDVQISTVISNYSTHEVVKDQSFDLGKIIKYFTNQASFYAGKVDALPHITLLKRYYDNIENIQRTNDGTDKPVMNAKKGNAVITGIRTNSVRRMADYWERVVLGDSSKKHSGLWGSTEIKHNNDKEIAEITDKLKDTTLSREQISALEKARKKLILKDKVRNIGQTIYSKEDKDKLAEIEVLLAGGERDLSKVQAKIKELNDNIDNPETASADVITSTSERDALIEREKLLKIQEGLGRNRTWTAFMDSFFNWIVHQRLGWNVNSGVTNFAEGWFSNMILAADGNYFTPSNIYTAYGLMRANFAKNITFGRAEIGIAKTIRTLMDKFDVQTDVANEMQKSSQKTMSDKISWLHPMAMTRRVEFMNQGVLMIATLMDQKITDKDGQNEISVLKAMQSNGILKEEYRTDDNVLNWEKLQGQKYLEYKKNLNTAIQLGHGNYSKLRGMMAKSNNVGRALMGFKTWLPQQIFWRFAVEQHDISSGSIAFKGKYWSYRPPSGALHGATVGAILGGPVGALIGAGAGAVWGAYANKQYQRDSVGMLQETLVSTVMLVKKLIGMPLNSITGRNLIETNKGFRVGSKVYSIDDWVGKGKFTKQDANALNSNLSDIAIQLMLLATMLITKGLFWDDDDDEDSAKRRAHNLLVNKLMQLSSQSTSYVNIGSKEGVIQSITGNVGILDYLTEVGKTVYDFNDLVFGKDEIPTGIHKGESKFWNQLVRTAAPGFTKSPLTLGFESMADRQFKPSPWDKHFKINVAENRKEIKIKMQDEGATSKEITEKQNELFPTKARLKKNGMTRKEWLDKYK